VQLSREMPEPVSGQDPKRFWCTCAER
jgi:hypothetical protein